MRLKYGENTYNLDVNSNENTITISYDDNDLTLNYAKQNEHIRFNRDGEIIDVFVASDRDNIYVQINARQYIFKKLEDEDDIAVSELQNENEDRILPPMPGSIIKVNVKEGDTVSEGDAVIIVEAMKMETSLYSRISGVVKEINVSEGEKVDADTVLAVIEKDE